MGPYGIAQVDVPGILGAYEGRQQNRMLMMMQQRQMERQEAQAEEESIEQKLERHREQFVQGARLLEGVNDPETYQAARQAAVRAGLDVSEVPASYDPAYVESVRRIGRAFGPQSQPGQGFTLSPGQVRYGPDGQRIAEGEPERPRYYSVPQGGQLVIEPGRNAGQRSAPPSAVNYLRQNPNLAPQFDEMYGEGAAERILQGGASQPGSQTFPQGEW